MKKTMIMMAAVLGIAFSGCTPDETTLVGGAQTAGSIAMLTWFSIDDPTPEVKTVLKEVVAYVEGATVSIADGNTYLDSVLPYVQEFVTKQDKLNDYQKTLVNAGSVVALNALDTFLASNPKVKDNAELASKVVASFCKGCQTVLGLPEDSRECVNAKAVYAKRSMKCRGGKFVTEK